MPRIFSAFRIEDTHIWKEIIKEELGSKSIWWKMRHPFKTYDMWSFMKTAEKALKDVQFTAEDGVRVTQEYKTQSASTDDDVQRIMDDIDRIYDNMEKEQSEPQSSVISQANENDKQPMQVKVDEPVASTEISQPISQNPNLEKGSIQIS